MKPVEEEEEVQQVAQAFPSQQELLKCLQRLAAQRAEVADCLLLAEGAVGHWTHCADRAS